MLLEVSIEFKVISIESQKFTVVTHTENQKMFSKPARVVLVHKEGTKIYAKLMHIAQYRDLLSRQKITG